MYSSDVKRLIEKRAYEIWESDDRLHGNDLADWLRAEAQVLGTSDNLDNPESKIESTHEAGQDLEEKLRVVEVAE